MTYLISLIVAIAITGTILFMYSSSLNEKEFLISNNALKIENEFVLLKKAYNNKLLYTGQKVESLTWEDEVSSYINIPENQYGYTYIFERSATGDYFCLYKNNESVNNIYVDSLIRYTENNNFSFIGNSCGITSSESFNNNVSDVAVTYYVEK